MAETSIISTSEALEALNRAEVDIQVETAKRWPMHSTKEQIDSALAKAEAYALVDSETAESCFYRLEREGKDGKKSVIEGPSIRLAEIIANAWGNLRIATRVIGNDGKRIKAQGACHDLESNVAQMVEAERGITTSKGFTFSEDMQRVTGQAAMAIARRNAILAVIPAAIFKPLYGKIKQKAIGEVEKSLETRRAKMLKTYALAGVTDAMLCKYLGVENIEDINAEMVVNLAGLWNALRDGQTTVEEAFKASVEEDKAARIRKRAAEAKGRVAAAAAGAKAAAETAPDAGKDDDMPGDIVDEQTGEVLAGQK